MVVIRLADHERICGVKGKLEGKTGKIKEWASF
jgi:hypothetical protein